MSLRIIICDIEFIVEKGGKMDTALALQDPIQIRIGLHSGDVM